MTLDELLALNDEIAALVRAGVPLEQGLAELGADMPGRLGRAAEALAERCARGESLEQALADQALDLPPAYRAVVEAGIRAGRLPAALQAVAAAAHRTAETQRAAIVAVSYPLLIFALVWIGLAVFSQALAPSLAASFRALDVPGQWVFATLAQLGRSAWLWGDGVPLLLAVLVFFWWRACTRAATLHSRRADWLLGWLPWMGQVLRCSRSATFLEILALLVENKTPLDEAVLLAASASGDQKTRAAAWQLSEAIRRGQTGAPAAMPTRDSAFPPMMNWLVLAANREGALLPALQHSADIYHRRARNQSQLLRVLLPVLLTVTMAGSVTAVYALALFFPYTIMLKSLAH
jgi:type II secretory pathway component PulF